MTFYKLGLTSNNFQNSPRAGEQAFEEHGIWRDGLSVHCSYRGPGLGSYYPQLPSTLVPGDVMSSDSAGSCMNVMYIYTQVHVHTHKIINK